MSVTEKQAIELMRDVVGKGNCLDAINAIIAERDALRQEAATDADCIHRLTEEHDRLTAEVLRLQAERDAMAKDAAPAFVANIQAAVDKFVLPDLAPTRLEYFKAGARAAFTCVNRALSPATSTGSEVGK